MSTAGSDGGRSPGRLSGRVALISGAARGQGAVEAARFLAEGAAGVILGDVLLEELESTEATLREDHPGRVHSLRLDVTSAADWAQAVSLADERFGGLHVLVNNAGIGASPEGAGDVADLSEEAWRHVIDVNLTGAFLGTRAALPLIRRTVEPDVSLDPRASGSIVNISSGQAFRPSAGSAAYAASKWGLRGLTRVTALEEAPFVRANVVIPGPIATPMISALLDDSAAAVLAQLIADVPMGRVGEPQEVADLVVFLASREGSYCTGADFLVEGGRIAGPARLRPPPG